SAGSEIEVAPALRARPFETVLALGRSECLRSFRHRSAIRSRIRSTVVDLRGAVVEYCLPTAHGRRILFAHLEQVAHFGKLLDGLGRDARLDHNVASQFCI